MLRGWEKSAGGEFQPPLRPQYRALLQSPHVSYNSRILKSALAYGSQGTISSREHGGLGMYDQGLAFLHLMGKAYLVLRTPAEGCNPFDNHMLPKEVLFDGAVTTLSMQLHCLGTVYTFYVLGCTVHVHRGHCPRAQGALCGTPHPPHLPPPFSPLLTPQPYMYRYMRKVGNVHVNTFPSPPLHFSTLPHSQGSVRAQSTTP